MVLVRTQLAHLVNENETGQKVTNRESSICGDHAKRVRAGGGKERYGTRSKEETRMALKLSQTVIAQYHPDAMKGECHAPCVSYHVLGLCTTTILTVCAMYSVYRWSLVTSQAFQQGGGHVYHTAAVWAHTGHIPVGRYCATKASRTFRLLDRSCSSHAEKSSHKVRTGCKGGSVIECPWVLLEKAPLGKGQVSFRSEHRCIHEFQVQEE